MSTSSLKVKLLIPFFASLGACSSPPPLYTLDSPTLYLHASGANRRSPVARHHPSTHRTSLATRILSPTETARMTPAADGDGLPKPLRPRRAQLLHQIENFSKDEADFVCLTLELIPREELFDLDVKPREILARYTSRAASEAELDTIERAIEKLRR